MYVYSFMGVGYVPWPVYGGQRTTFRSWFSAGHLSSMLSWLFWGGVSKRVTCGRSYKELPPVDRRLPGEVLWWQSQPWFVRVPSPDITFLCEMEAEHSCTFSRFTACGLMIWPAIRCWLLCMIPRNHTRVSLALTWVCCLFLGRHSCLHPLSCLCWTLHSP